MKKTLLLPLFLISMALWFANCNQAGPCTGSLTLENPIPDITVAVGDTVLIDLTNPPVFVSSEGEITYSINEFREPINIYVNLVDNPNENNKNSLLLISGRNIGEAGIKLGAFSDCLENSTNININITES